MGYDQALLDELARRLACERAADFIICLADWFMCGCVGTQFTAQIPIVSNHPPFNVALESGTIPVGVRATTQGNAIIITGNPAISGTYVFTLRVTDTFGNSQTRQYRMVILSITNASLPNWSTGVAYSAQLVATGGSGNYGWRIISGTMPDGLTLSDSGLISGTPTGLGGGGAVVFDVVDTNCQAQAESVLPPRIFMTTVSRTAIKTKRGWPKWTGYDGTLWKTATFTGESTQTAFPALAGTIDGPQCGGAKYEMSGWDEIDEYGRHLSQHVMELFVECNNDPPQLFTTELLPTGDAFLELTPSVPTLLGYCWATDPLSCPSCNHDDNTWLDAGNRSIFGAPDFPRGIINLNTSVITDFVKSISGHNEFGQEFGLTIDPTPPRETFPTNTQNGFYVSAFPFVVLLADGAWSVTLSNEYTAADANNSAIRYTSNGPVAENYPNYNTFTRDTFLNVSSRTTEVTYALNCINLIVGRDYIVSVQYRDSSGAIASVSTTFTANDRTQSIVQVIPTPAAGHNIRVLNPRIRFAPVT